MSKFVKTAIAAAMVMGAFTSTATIAAGNNGTTFYGTIEDSVCSIVPDDHKLEVDMGDIGAENQKITAPPRRKFPDSSARLRI